MLGPKDKHAQKKNYLFERINGNRLKTDSDTN